MFKAQSSRLLTGRREQTHVEGNYCGEEQLLNIDDHEVIGAERVAVDDVVFEKVATKEQLRKVQHEQKRYRVVA